MLIPATNGELEAAHDNWMLNEFSVLSFLIWVLTVHAQSYGSESDGDRDRKEEKRKRKRKKKRKKNKVRGREIEKKKRRENKHGSHACACACGNNCNVSGRVYHEADLTSLVSQWWDGTVTGTASLQRLVEIDTALFRQSSRMSFMTNSARNRRS
jgi:hypothetical protein